MHFDVYYLWRINGDKNVVDITNNRYAILIRLFRRLVRLLAHTLPRLVTNDLHFTYIDSLIEW